jgi:hypothetical protein
MYLLTISTCERGDIKAAVGPNNIPVPAPSNIIVTSRRDFVSDRRIY